MAQEIITLENLAAEIAKLRGELATWKALAIKQDRLNTAQMLAVNSGATAGKIAQIATNTSDIAALQQIASSAFRVVKVAQLPASGESYIMYLVPQTDGETLNYCNEYLWIDNAWELVGTTGAMANNGELQIIVNGVTVGTFTANQATNSAASITVPTDTSQLTNGAGYVDATALATALASKQDSLSLVQLAAVNSGITSADVAQIGANTTAIAGKQDALTTSQLAAVNSGITSADVTQIGTNTGNIATNSAAIISLQGSKQNALSAAQLLAVNSGITSSLVTQIGTNQSDITTLNTALGQSLTPSADNTYSLGGASFRYANVYAVTFTGDLTGTASKAIADEDGTSIKTGYVNVAGDQDVTGRKTFRGNAFFTSGVYHRNSSYVIGNTPATNITITHNFADKDNNYTGFVRDIIYSTGRTGTEVRARNLFKNGVLDPTGSEITSSFNVEVQPNGDKTLYFDGSIRNNVLPYATNTYSLGSSSYQWSSVYAQTYYYNGTAWGLDKANVWTGVNTFSIATAESIAVKHTTYKGAILFSTNGVSNFKNYNTFFKWDISGYDNTFGLYRSVGVLGDTTTGATDEDIDTSFSLWKAHIRSKSLDFTDSVKVTNDGTENSLKPITNNATDLGTSTNKWKTLNGVNPGALSLPSDSGVSFSGDITNTTGTTNNPKTWTVNGWGYIRVPNSATSDFISVVTSDTHEAYLVTGTGAGNSNIGVSFPIVAGRTYYIYVSTSGNVTAYYFPCLGNV